MLRGAHSWADNATTDDSAVQAAAAALEHLQAGKQDHDYYAQLTEHLGAAAVAAAAAAAGGQGGDGLAAEFDGLDGSGPAGDKPLTSRFR